VLIAVGIVMLITAITGDIGGCGNKTSSLATVRFTTCLPHLVFIT
jgi:hypothetical protein